jgi:quercetin dioxygenase-like cupin family protein
MPPDKLPPVRRVVTGHDSEGRAVLWSDDQLETARIPSGAADFVHAWAAGPLPVDNNDEFDCWTAGELGQDPASIVRIVDLLPGRASQMHRTNSLDYGILVSGELELELDGGDKIAVNPGDIVVQRGTMHLWRNPSSTSPCRIVFVLTEAKPYLHDGEPLPEVHG